MRSIYIALSPELYEQFGLERFRTRWEPHAALERWPGPGAPQLGSVLEALKTTEILVTGWDTPPLIDTLSGWSPDTSPLRLVAHSAGTVKFLLPLSALEGGLQVTHANAAMVNPVAEFTLAAMLSMRRKVFLSAQRYREHSAVPGYDSMHDLSGSVVGIIGASAIGRRVMELLGPWQVRLLLYDPYISAESATAYGAELVSLLDLCRRADIVSLHAPVTDETVGMLHAEHFRAMQDGAVFINTARGRLVDHPALLSELQTGRISALLDVTDPDEPLPPGSPFFSLDNCILTPHQAGATLETRLNMGQMIGEDVLNYLEGRPLLHRVRPERWKTMA